MSRSLAPALVPAQQPTAKANMGAVPFRTSRLHKRTAGNSQADMRRPALMHDQHGRQWSCSIENRSGMSTGLITNDFSAPWLPDQPYLVQNPENPSELWIDYRRMYLDRKHALASYHAIATQLAADKGWPIPSKGTYAQEIRRVLGNPPLPLQPVKAAAQGNPWVLGFTDVPDPRLVEFIQPPETLDLDLEDEEDYGEAGYEASVGGVAPSVTPAVVDDFTAGEYGAAAQPAMGDEDFDELDAEDGDEDVSALLDLVDDEAESIEAAHDQPALGGRTVPAGKEAVAMRQAPRRPQSTAKAHKKGESRAHRSTQQHRAKEQRTTMKSLRAAHGDGRASLADGASPIVSDAMNLHELIAE